MKKRDRLFFFLFILYLGVVLWCCFGNFQSLPDVQQEYFGIPTDKIVHFLMFLPFVFLCYMSFASLPKKASQALLLAIGALAAGVIMAIATEIGQSLTSYRSGDSMDFVADAAGLCLAFAVTIVHIFTTKR